MVASLLPAAAPAAQPLVWAFTYSRTSGIDLIFVRWLDEHDVPQAGHIPHVILDGGHLWVPVGGWPANMDATTRGELIADVENFTSGHGARFNLARVAQVEAAVLS